MQQEPITGITECWALVRGVGPDPKPNPKQTWLARRERNQIWTLLRRSKVAKQSHIFHNCHIIRILHGTPPTEAAGYFHLGSQRRTRPFRAIVNHVLTGTRPYRLQALICLNVAPSRSFSTLPSCQAKYNQQDLIH